MFVEVQDVNDNAPVFVESVVIGGKSDQNHYKGQLLPLSRVWDP